MRLPRFAPQLVFAVPLLLVPIVPARAQDKLRIDGATGVLPLARSLAAAWNRRFPASPIETGAGLGTSARLQALAEGKIHIAVASHGLDPDALREGNLNVVPMAKGGVVFAVNQAVSVAGLTEQQVCDIYSGTLSSWRGVGGSNDPVVVLTRPGAEVDMEVIRATVGCFKDLEITGAARVMPGGGEMARALSETRFAIGMTSMTVVAQSGGKMRVLALDGVDPSPENIGRGAYRLTRGFYFVVKGEPGGLVKRFLDFVKSAEGAEVIRGNGAIPVK
jgi:phosphate transport system substrate-binding protein